MYSKTRFYQDAINASTKYSQYWETSINYCFATRVVLVPCSDLNEAFIFLVNFTCEEEHNNINLSIFLCFHSFEISLKKKKKLFNSPLLRF